MGFNTLIGTRAKMMAREPQRTMPHLFSQNAARESNLTSCRYCNFGSYPSFDPLNQLIEEKYSGYILSIFMCFFCFYFFNKITLMQLK